MRPLLALLLWAFAASVALAGCGSSDDPATLPVGGDAARGTELIEAYGCGGCHTIGGIEGADARVGPPLTDFQGNRTVAGTLPNTPENVIRFLQSPQEVVPGGVMPDLGIPDAAARDIAAYLYSQ